MKWTLVPAEARVDVEAIAEMVDHLDRPDFDRALLNALGLGRHVVQEACGINCSLARRREAVGWFGRRADASLRARRLASTYFERDPFLRALPRAAGDGDSFVSALRASGIDDDEYRWHCFDDPGFSQRVSIARTEEGGWAILCLFLAEEITSDSELMRLAGMAALAFPFVRRHNGWTEGALRAPLPQDPAQRIADLLGKRYPSLTRRERHVCAMTVLGNDSSAIARDLAITRSTVLTYRRRAYERLGVSSASAMMAELV